MKIKCCGCHDTFDVPDDKGITSAICPFCEHANDLRKPTWSIPAMGHTAKAPPPLYPNTVPVRRQFHPLSTQLWIMAICALIVTTIIVIGSFFKVVSIVEQRLVLEEIEKELKRTFPEFDKTLNQNIQTNQIMQSFQQSLNQLKKSF